MLQDIDSGLGRAEFISKIVPWLENWPITKLYPAWCKLLHNMNSNSRKASVQELRSMIPLIYKLGGKDSIQEIVSALSNINRWWP